MSPKKTIPICAVLILILNLFSLTFSSQSHAAPAPVAGTWATLDDSTGKKRALIDIKISDGVLTGTISRVFSEPGDSGMCDHCPDAFKDKPILGLQFLWGLKEDADKQWTGGHILDPKSGKIYQAKLSLDGNKLLVRGYLGFSLLGRTQTWVKE